MLAAVSHELRTPLNSIIGFSDMMLHGLAGNFADARQKEYVGLVRESGSHLLSLVNSILDISRLEAGAFNAKPEPFRFEDAVEMCRSMLAQQAREKGIALTTEIPAEVGEIHADKRAVKQMLINLVCNAIKFTPNGGSVSVGAKRTGSHLHFWVADTGIGITRHDLARLGQPFVQVDNDYTRSFEGAGLGLSLVKGLVALHQGSMSIDSEPDHGTTVTIDLPVERLASHAPVDHAPVGHAPAPMGHAIESAEILAMAGNRSKEAHDGTFRKTA
jgi:cell cycle sensor histidine kinase DivJ